MELQKRKFIQVINDNQGMIKSLCQAYYVSSEDQKDAFQDIVLQLWKSFDSFRGKSAISTWIYKVSLNTLLTKVRKEKKCIATAPLNPSTFSLPTSNADDDVELLSIIIQSLQDLDKAIVILYLEGYKHKEIAQILALTATNVSTRLNRVTSQLRTKFKNSTHATRRF